MRAAENLGRFSPRTLLSLGPLSNQLCVLLLIRPRTRISRKPPRRHPSIPSQPQRQPTITKHPTHTPSRLPHITRIKQQPRHPIRNNLTNPRNRRRHHRQPNRHRLSRRQTKTLNPRRRQKQIMLPQQHRNIPTTTQQLHPITHPQLTNQRLNLTTIRPLTHHTQRHPRHLSHRPHRTTNVLASVLQAGHDDHPTTTLRQLSRRPLQQAIADSVEHHWVGAGLLAKLLGQIGGSPLTDRNHAL